MKTLPDAQLLREYTERHSDAAFEELVRRHIDLVHAVAQRTLQDPHLAKDVTQGVFLALARSAGSLTKHQALVGWLHTTARHIAAQAVRGERRRHAREQAAAAMDTAPESGPGWEAISPQLDLVIGELAEADREAILLRYFEKKPAQEMAALLGISSEAAQKRVNRAVERMRLLFAKRGITAGATGLAGVIAAHAAPPAPLGLAAAVTERSLAAMASTATSTSATATLAMTLAQKSALAAAIVILAGSCLYLTFRDPSASHAGAGPSSTTVAPTKSRPAPGTIPSAGSGSANSRSQAQNPQLASLKRRWLEIGDDNNRIAEQDALALETVEKLSCGQELYDLAAFMEDKARYGLAKIETDLDNLFRSSKGQEARMALAELTKLVEAGKQNTRLEEWCYIAGKNTPAEGGDFKEFHAAISSDACAQEATLGWSLSVVESDPEAAVAMVLEILKVDLHSQSKDDHLKRLFLSDVKLPEDIDFAKLEAMFPLPSRETDVMKLQPQDWARMELFGAWGRRDPEAAADYVMAHPDRCEPSLIQRIRSQPRNATLEDELAWVNRFSPGPYFDAAAFAAADRMLWSHPQEAPKLAERISDPKIRAKFAERAETVHKMKNRPPHERDGG